MERLVSTTRLAHGESSFKAVLKTAIHNAVTRGYSWELTIDEFRKLSLSSCAYCGAPPSNSGKHSVRSNGRFRYSGLDRVDNTVGYTLANVVPCCKTCNQAKNNLTLAAFHEWALNLAASSFLQNGVPS
jgi:5-methylcytosine-specific restriction endonuclease McrA